MSAARRSGRQKASPYNPMRFGIFNNPIFEKVGSIAQSVISKHVTNYVATYEVDSYTFRIAELGFGPLMGCLL
jgi:hypothetical protein